MLLAEFLAIRIKIFTLMRENTHKWAGHGIYGYLQNIKLKDDDVKDAAKLVGLR